MPRANRYFVPGNIWHITHRCHKRDLLLKFKKDRIRWIQWLFEAKKRYHLKILNYIITSNHIHLLVLDDYSNEVIPRAMQLIQARMGQEYNIRKNRNGAFWEDRYHATAIGSDRHLIRCIVYINMNMVRAGVVNHPVKWKESGYYEIQNPKKRYSIIDYATLMEILNFNTINELQKAYKEWIEDALENNANIRESKWTESIAVGSKTFVENIHKRLNIKTKSRKIINTNEVYELSEPIIPYNNYFYIKNDTLS